MASEDCRRLERLGKLHDGAQLGAFVACQCPARRAPSAGEGGHTCTHRLTARGCAGTHRTYLATSVSYASLDSVYQRPRNKACSHTQGPAAAIGRAWLVLGRWRLGTPASYASSARKLYGSCLGHGGSPPTLCLPFSQRPGAFTCTVRRYGIHEIFQGWHAPGYVGDHGMGTRART